MPLPRRSLRRSDAASPPSETSGRPRIRPPLSEESDSDTRGTRRRRPGRRRAGPVETILVPDPGPGEAVVKVQACGVCHTDLHYREGGINDEFPFLLGHEAAGVVESVGEGVTDVAPGDFVILNWRAVCGQCRACRAGGPWYCFDTHNAKQKMTLADGTELSPALGIGAFAEKTLVAAGQCTKVDPSRLGRRRRAARLRRDGRASAPPSTPATSAAATPSPSSAAAASATRRSPGARLAGAAKIIAVDVDDRKLERAEEFGATHTVNSSRDRRRSRRSASCTGGFGADVVIEAVGRPETYKQAFYARDLAGTVVLVGVPTPEMTARAAAAGRLRPRRRAEVLLVRRLPALPRLPRAHRPLPAGPARPGRASSPRPSRSTTSRRPSTRCTAATSCARWWSCDGRAIDHLVTSGTFSLDGGTWDVDNNVWIVGDDQRGRRHRRRPRRRRHRRRPLGDRHAARHRLHPRPQRPHRRRPRPRRRAPARPSCCTRTTCRCGSSTPPADRTASWPTARSLTVAGTDLTSCTPPGHAPGAVCLYAPELGALFTGDTLFQGGPGATGRSFSHFATIIDSIRDRLLALPADTVVHTGHGDTTTIGAEAPHLEEWITRDIDAPSENQNPEESRGHPQNQRVIGIVSGRARRDGRMAPSYDVIVVGLGGMGSAAAAHLAARGQRVLGLERFGPAHDLGSSHGGSRIIRQSYFEDPAYVPLLLRAYELWDAARGRLRPRRATQTGGLMIGPRRLRGPCAGTLRSARSGTCRTSCSTPPRSGAAFPTFDPADDEVGLLRGSAGFARPEATVTAHLRPGRAPRRRPALRGAGRSDWTATAGRQASGDHRPAAAYTADRLVICPRRLGAVAAGRPRAAADGRAAGHVLVPARRRRRPFTADRHPVYIWERRRTARRSTASRRRRPRRRREGGVLPARAVRQRPRDRRPGGPRRRGRAPWPSTCAARAADAARAASSRRGLHVHQHPGRALRHRPAPRARAGDGRLRVLRPRLQVRARRRRDPRRPRARRHHRPPHRPLRPPPRAP